MILGCRSNTYEGLRPRRAVPRLIGAGLYTGSPLFNPARGIKYLWSGHFYVNYHGSKGGEQMPQGIIGILVVVIIVVVVLLVLGVI